LTSSDGTVQVFLGEGDGTFFNLVRYSDINPFCVSLVDLNCDGILDMAIANNGRHTAMIMPHPGYVSVKLGDGNGEFTLAQDFDAGEDPSAVVIGEFNGDAIPDLAIANETSNDVTVMLGNGDGSFTAGVTCEVGLRPMALVVGDFNQDSLADLITADNDANTISLLPGNGDGSFQTASAIDVGQGPRALAIADIDEDGLDDLAVALAQDDAVAILPGESGGFTAGQTEPVGDNPRSVILHDLDGDGHVDLAPANYGDDTITMRRGHGDGSFTGEKASFNVEGWNPAALTAADCDRDGLIDLAVVTAGSFISNINRRGCTLNILRGVGNGDFLDEPFGIKVERLRSGIAQGDFNEDGIADLAVAFRADPGGIVAFLGLGNGEFDAGSEYPTGYQSQTVLAVDLNEDDHLDLAVANLFDNNISILIGQGDGAFGAATHYDLLYQPAELTAGDLDGDGHVDLAAASYRLTDELIGALEILRGVGDGTFQTATTYQTPGQDLRSLAATDLNGDDFPDLVAAHYGHSAHSPYTTGGSLLVFLNDGQGLFTGPVSYAANDGPYRVVAGDFNDDGHADLAVGNRYDGSRMASVLLGNGDGTLQTPTAYATGGETSSLALDDLNGDGHLDLIVGTDEFGSNLSILTGNGDGAFDAAETYYLGFGSGIALTVGYFK